MISFILAIIFFNDPLLINIKNITKILHSFYVTLLNQYKNITKILHSFYGTNFVAMIHLVASPYEQIIGTWACINFSIHIIG
jgi:hypothetical protein